LSLNELGLLDLRMMFNYLYNGWLSLRPLNEPDRYDYSMCTSIQ